MNYETRHWHTQSNYYTFLKFTVNFCVLNWLGEWVYNGNMSTIWMSTMHETKFGATPK